jgi:hypothetical protein
MMHQACASVLGPAIGTNGTCGTSVMAALGHLQDEHIGSVSRIRACATPSEALAHRFMNVVRS